MYRLSPIIVFLALAINLSSQTFPHGADLKIDCGDCHTTAGWEIDLNSIRFSHDSTNFSLLGQHVAVDCNSCHQSLVFSDANTECLSCHTDMHEQTVGSDCARCHTAENWLVDNITEIHQDNGFPLLGAHAPVNCFDCHVSETGLRFDRIGNDCYNCHLEDYVATSSPNHIEAGYSTDCGECHDFFNLDWNGGINHNFFPLTLGHDIADCAQCHIDRNYSNTPTDCFSCHQTDYDESINPNHQSLNFSINCVDCHTTSPDWMPAEYLQHDMDYFPIYSGKHEGEWDSCVDCHTVAGNYALFSCIDCHEHNNQADLNDEHSEVSDYSYSSAACYSCHPTGEED